MILKNSKNKLRISMEPNESDEKIKANVMEQSKNGKLLAELQCAVKVEIFRTASCTSPLFYINKFLTNICS